MSERERRALNRARGARLPLLLVGACLALALCVPRLTQRRIAGLRNEITNFTFPARLELAEIQLELAAEASARRGYLLAHDTGSLREIDSSRTRRQRAEQQLLEDARGLEPSEGSAIGGAVARLERAAAGLDLMILTDGDDTHASFERQRRIAEHMETLSDSIGALIGQAAAERRNAIAATETIVAVLTTALVILGLAAACLVARLGSRYRVVALRLDESDARFRQIAENLNDVVWLAEPSLHRQLYVNAAYERIWGRPRDELYADPGSFIEHVHPDDRAFVRERLAAIGSSAADVEFRVVRPDGTIRWVWNRGFPVRDSSGRVFRVGGIAEDVTERHQHAVAIERVTESRARLIRGFTHDVKNPLGAADGYLSLVEGGIYGALGEPQRTAVAKARQSIHDGLDLIAQLLDVARAETGRLELHKQATNIGRLVHEVVDAFEAHAVAKRIELRCNVDQRLPAVQTDPARVRQVVGNLVSNAIKYTPGNGHVEVCVTESPRDGSAPALLIHVCDDGPGIPEDKMPLLFAEFSRFDSSAAEGAGIGLAISQRIAHALGGEIIVDSRAGVGSRFSLRLPRG